MCLAKIAAAIDVGATGQHAEEVGHMLTKPVDVDPIEEGGKFRIV